MTLNRQAASETARIVHRIPVLLAFLIVPSYVLAATPTPKQTYLHYPTGVGAYEWGSAIGVTLDILSPRLIESEQRFVPRLTGAFRYGFPAGFSLEASLDAIVLVNELRMGLQWSINTGPVAWALHDRLGLWFGYIGVDGFDTHAVGLIQYPGASVGTIIAGHHLSLTFEVILVHAQRVDFGDASVSRTNTAYGGFSLRLLLESPVGPGVLYYGATFFQASPDYQLWLAFSDGRRKVQFVRFHLGYEL